MGALPSSRLTKILQEKAELLKKRRVSAEQILHDAEERVRQLDLIEITLPDSKEREARLKELARHADWEAVEIQAKAFLEYLGKEAQTAVEQRRAEVVERGERLVRSGSPLPEDVRALLSGLAAPVAEGDWGATVEKLTRLSSAIRAFASPCFPGLEVWMLRIRHGSSSTIRYRPSLSSRTSCWVHAMASAFSDGRDAGRFISVCGRNPARAAGAGGGRPTSGSGPRCRRRTVHGLPVGVPASPAERGEGSPAPGG